MASYALTPIMSEYENVQPYSQFDATIQLGFGDKPLDHNPDKL